MEELRTTSLKGIAVLNAMSLFQVVLRLVHITLMARLIPPEAFGIAAMVASVMFISMSVNDAGMTSVLVRQRELSQSLKSSVFWLQVAIALSLAMIVFFSSGSLAGIYGVPSAKPFFQFIAIALLLHSISAVPWALTQRDQRFDRMALCDGLAMFSAVVISVGLGYIGTGVWALVSFFVAQYFIRSALLFFVSRFRPSPIFSISDIRSIWPYSRNLIAAQMMETLAIQFDRLIIGMRLGPSNLGIYSQAVNINTTPFQMLTSGAGVALFPAFSRMQDDRTRLAEAYLESTQMLTLIAFPVFAGIAAVATPAIEVLLGSNGIWDWSPVSSVLPILCVATAMQSATNFNGIIFLALSRTSFVFVGSLLHLVSIVGLLSVGVHWGVLGAAIGYVCAIVLSGTMITRFALGLLGLRLGDWLAKIVRPGLCSLLMFFIVTLVSDIFGLSEIDPIFELLILIPTGVVLYISLVFLIDRELARRFVSALKTILLGKG